MRDKRAGPRVMAPWAENLEREGERIAAGRGARESALAQTGASVDLVGQVLTGGCAVAYAELVEAGSHEARVALLDVRVATMRERLLGLIVNRFGQD